MFHGRIPLFIPICTILSAASLLFAVHIAVTWAIADAAPDRMTVIVSYWAGQ